MRVRLSTVERGKVFFYRGRAYQMGAIKRDVKTKSTFRWALNLETGKYWKMTVHGSTSVELPTAAREKLMLQVAEREGVELVGSKKSGVQSGSASQKTVRRVVRRPVKKTVSTATKVAKVLVSKGKFTYRVTAKWRVRNGWDRKEFRVNADNAASALQVVQKQQTNSKVTVHYLVAKVES